MWTSNSVWVTLHSHHKFIYLQFQQVFMILLISKKKQLDSIFFFILASISRIGTIGDEASDSHVELSQFQVSSLFQVTRLVIKTNCNTLSIWCRLCRRHRLRSLLGWKIKTFHSINYSHRFDKNHNLQEEENAKMLSGNYYSNPIHVKIKSLFTTRKSLFSHEEALRE